ncbi:MAG TPA: hypothetical protein VM686_11680 [Polyangiaceae bacterium]|nr:hypothetical protein [Polyangiaceae bacterium]
MSFVLLAACSAGKAPERPGTDSGANSASGSGNGDGIGGLSGIGTGGRGGSTASPTGWIPADLAPPWQYYAEDADRAYKDPALGANVRELFSGAAKADAELAIVYPLDGAMHPLNQTHLLFQWHRGAESNTLFRIDAVGGDGRTSRYYVPCTAIGAAHQCSYQMPVSDWLWLGADYAGSSVDISISATDGAAGPVATSPAIRAYFSPEPVYGALYYWASSVHSLKRANFDAGSAVAYIAPESESNQFKCVGCHSISRNGKVIAFAVSNLFGETVAGIQSAPTEAPQSPFVEPAMGTTPFSAGHAHAGDGEPGTLEEQPLDHFGHNVALSPDGAIAAINGIPAPEDDPDGNADGWPAFLELRDTQSGETIVRQYMSETEGTASGPFAYKTLLIQPEWSPDGTALVGALLKPDDVCKWTYTTADADIAIVPIIDKSAFGPAQVIATSSDPTEFHFNPTWSADQQWIAFMSARREPDPDSPNPCQHTNSSFNQNAVIRMVRADGSTHVCPGPECIELPAGTQYTVEDAFDGHRGKHSTWPKFTPFVQGQAGNVMFLSFTSGIDYGWVSTAAQNAPRNYAKNQIWMFGVDVSKVGSGDPSFAPIWLPQQDPGDGSLTPYWTETLPCQSDPAGGCVGCAAGEECHVSAGNVCECRAVAVK